MTSDRAFELLERENPVREDELPGPQSAEARALERRILAREARPRRRRPVVRLAAVGVAVAAVGFGALSLLPGDGTSAVERATAALNPSGDSILHTVVVATRSDGAGSTTTETWLRTTPPYDRRYVMRGGAARREAAVANGQEQFYDHRTNTIYTMERPIEVPPPGRSGRKGVEDDLSILEDIRSLLASGDARERGRVTVDGREGILIVFSRSGTRLVVDTDSYEPIEWTTVGGGAAVTNRFRTYERLPATQANLAHVSLKAQHPGAKISPTIAVEGVGGPKGQ
jgi:hypothetical protein